MVALPSIRKGMSVDAVAVAVVVVEVVAVVVAAGDVEAVDNIGCHIAEASERRLVKMVAALGSSVVAAGE